MADKWSDGVRAGSADVTVPVVLRKTADNTELTGITSTGPTASYWRQGGTRTGITLAALGSVNAAHSDGGWYEADGTNLPGTYRLDLPDAAVASGADWVMVEVKQSTAYVHKVVIPLTTRTVATDVYGLIDELETRLTAVRAALLDNLDTSVSSRATPSHVAAEVQSALTAAQGEAYPAYHANASVIEMLYAILARLTEITISGTAMTVKKVSDGSTTAATLTLNDATNPTSTTRTS